MKINSKIVDYRIEKPQEEKDAAAEAKVKALEFETSAGAEPGRCYSYLEYHLSHEQHSILLFKVEENEDGPCVRAYRFDGSAAEVSGKVNALVHAA